MAYCTINDVNGLVPQQPFTANTIPNQATVEEFIGDITDEINATLRNIGYVVPVTGGAEALRLLRNANKWGALGLAQDARMTAVLRDEQVGGGRNTWTIRYDNWKKALLDKHNPYELPGAARTDAAVIKPEGSVESSTVNEPGYTYPTNPTFYIGMKL